MKTSRILKTMLISLCVLVSGCGSGDSKEKKFTIEYGEDTTLEKLLKQEEKLKVKDSFSFDVNIPGTYHIEINNEAKEKVAVKVEDTKMPEIVLKSDQPEYALSKDIAYEDNLKSVKDAVDGDIKDVKKLSLKEYKEKLEVIKKKKEELNKREFHSKDDLDKIKEEKEIPHHVVLAASSMEKREEGTYTVNLAAVDKNYNVTEKSFKIKVTKQKKDEKKEEEEKATAVENGASMFVPEEEQNSYASSTPTPSVSDPVASAAIARIGAHMACDELVSKAVIASGKITGTNKYDMKFIPMFIWTELGSEVSRSSARAGDIIYYSDGGAGCSHVAVYLGNNQAVHGGFDGLNVVRFSVDVGTGPNFYRLPGTLTWNDIEVIMFGQDDLDIKNEQITNGSTQQPSTNTETNPPEMPSMPDMDTGEDSGEDMEGGYSYQYELTENNETTHFQCPVDISDTLQQFMQGGMDKATLIQIAQQKGCTVN